MLYITFLINSIRWLIYLPLPPLLHLPVLETDATLTGISHAEQPYSTSLSRTFPHLLRSSFKLPCAPQASDSITISFTKITASFILISSDKHRSPCGPVLKGRLSKTLSASVRNYQVTTILHFYFSSHVKRESKHVTYYCTYYNSLSSLS